MVQISSTQFTFERVCFVWYVIVTSFLFLSACTPQGSVTPTSPPVGTVETGLQNPKTIPEPAYARITFNLVLPSNSASSSEEIYLQILDEVTGLALNLKSYLMEPSSDLEYTATLPLHAGFMIKYRYAAMRNSVFVQEYTGDHPVRYRMFQVLNPASVTDTLTNWSDTNFPIDTGRITGIALDENNETPIPNLLISAGGIQTISDQFGLFRIEGLPKGVHNLVGYDMDGRYRTFQQGALVVPELTTPVVLRLHKNPFVKVTFHAILPDDTPPGVPIRLAGNLRVLGNTFSDLRGGVSTLSSRMPVLKPSGQNTGSITIPLPAGTHIQYKYTLGDGYWNAEHTENGDFILHEIIVPTTDMEIVDQIQPWHAGDSSPLTFDVSVPENRSPAEPVFLQLNPFSWTEPIPMWQIEPYRWTYILYNPVDFLGAARYRYCLEGLCGLIDDNNTPGDNPSGHTGNTQNPPITFTDQVDTWTWSSAASEPAVVSSSNIHPRDPDFLAGIGLQTSYHPAWDPDIQKTMGVISGLGANTIVLSPTWTWTSANPPVLQAIPGIDQLVPDTAALVEYAKQVGLNVSFRPVIHTFSGGEDFWMQAKLTPEWWQSWFEQIQTFLLNQVELANEHGVGSLFLGGDWFLPAEFIESSNSTNPYSQSTIEIAAWSSFLEEINSRYQGTLAWVLPQDRPDLLPRFSEFFDAISVPVYYPLTDVDHPDQDAIHTAVNALLDGSILQIKESSQKPIILFIAYPSVDGSASACVPNIDGDCLTYPDIIQPVTDSTNAALNLVEQAAIYDAFLSGINTRSWVNGVISDGFFPASAISDKSASIRGKPASDVVWYWFSGFMKSGN